MLGQLKAHQNWGFENEHIQEDISNNTGSKALSGFLPNHFRPGRQGS
jgi:hypothetical protein